MLQIEQANRRVQLQQVVAQKIMVEKINPTIVAAIVLSGSLIKTDKGYLFMSVALGKAVVEGMPFMALSLQSPLGKELKGLKAGDTAIINNKVIILKRLSNWLPRLVVPPWVVYPLPTSSKAKRQLKCTLLHVTHIINCIFCIP